ncbi:unnamed protein product [Acanthoscelides obtectus]|uniref:Uncharacterized protein n=1 Tax=Acanthoscelides obtectus TaxID=200917 RepID=A0A9P0QEL3_ACAOB|nr:unnamed protein product [Acanthoscelides obtectus]CAK1687163.1 hypothetical protein AOBTE_LOCUS36198 [Acanthoscelides obtectus]
MNAGLHKEAIEEYRLGLGWREVIRLMTVLKYDESVKRDVLGKIADDLVKEKRVEEAVIVLESHNKDYKKTIKTLMDFKSFRHAICLAVSLGLDLELPTIADGLSKYLGDLKLLSFKDQFERYRRRLKIARKEQMNRNRVKVKNPQKLTQDELAAIAQVICDTDTEEEVGGEEILMEVNK